LMTLAANGGCDNCHPDQVNDFWTAANRNDIGRGVNRAYAHASDGTNVQAANAAVAGNLSVITGGVGATATCTNACHPRSSAITWGGALDCNMCHYYGSPTLDTNNTGTGSLSFGHNAHFKTPNQFACTECHPTRTDAVHATRLPVQSYNATLSRAGMTYNAVAKTCTNTGGACHGTGTTPAFTSTGGGCAACHYYPGAAAGLGDAWSAGNGHAAAIRHDAPVVNTHMKATGYAYLTDTYNAVVADNTKCGLCHRNTKHMNGSGFAHLSTVTDATYSQCGTTPFTFSTGGVGTGNGAVTCSNVKCHSGNTTPNWGP